MCVGTLENTKLQNVSFTHTPRTNSKRWRKDSHTISQSTTSIAHVTLTLSARWKIIWAFQTQGFGEMKARIECFRSKTSARVPLCRTNSTFSFNCVCVEWICVVRYTNVGWDVRPCGMAPAPGCLVVRIHRFKLSWLSTTLSSVRGSLLSMGSSDL